MFIVHVSNVLWLIFTLDIWLFSFGCMFTSLLIPFAVCWLSHATSPTMAMIAWQSARRGNCSYNVRAKRRMGCRFFVALIYTWKAIIQMRTRKTHWLDNATRVLYETYNDKREYLLRKREETEEICKKGRLVWAHLSLLMTKPASKCQTHFAIERRWWCERSTSWPIAHSPILDHLPDCLIPFVSK